MIYGCVCKHDFQDKTYGKHQRVFNPMKVVDLGMQHYRCTVCGREITKNEPKTIRREDSNEEES